MAEVALNRIAYGVKSKRLPDGSLEEVSPMQYVEVGESLPSGFDAKAKDELRAAGSLGDESLLRTTAQSTPAVLQSQEYAGQVEADAAAASARQVLPATPPTEDEIAKAHRIRTDEVLRESGDDPDKVIAEEEKVAAKATEADAKAAKEANK